MKIAPIFFEQHPKIYHYTSLRALRHIFERQTLWATHYKFLNDPSEMTFMRPMLRNMIERNEPEIRKSVENAGGLLEATNKQTDALVSALWDKHVETGLLAQVLDPFVVSFCSHSVTDDYTRKNGLLSQWVAYAGDSGCAIVFDTKQMAQMLQEEEDKFNILPDIAKVVYYHDEGAIDTEMPEFNEKLKAACDALVRGENNNAIGEYAPAQVDLACRLKHRAFQSEGEIRISATVITNEKYFSPNEHGERKLDKSIRFRDKGQIVIPYIELFEKQGSLPIGEIIIGPGTQQTSCVAAVERMCKSSGIHVKASETPFIFG